MKKAIKVILSRFVIISLILIMEVAFILLAIIKLNESFTYVYVISMVLSIFVLLFVISKDEPPSFKIPWILVITIVPILGLVIYLLFSKNYLAKYQRKRYERIATTFKPFQEPQDEVLNKLKETDILAHNQAYYISNSSKSNMYLDCYTEYFGEGQDFYEKFLEKLEQAEKFIFLEFFIIRPGKMWNTTLEILARKAAAGVDVRVIYDDFGCIQTLPYKYDSVLRKKGIKCTIFSKYLPILSVVHNNRDHRKIVVIDGYMGFTGGINLSDEYINEVIRFGHWKDSAIYLEGEAVKELTLMFLSTWKAHTRDDKNKSIESFVQMDFSKYRTGSGYVLPYADGPEPLYSERIGENAYMNIINSAKNYVYITTPYLIVDYNFTNALRNAAKRGVDVRIILPYIPDKKIISIMTHSSYTTLIEAGVKIYEYTPGFIHAKNFVSDDKIAIVGTINLDYRSLVHHFECAIWMYQTTAVMEVKKDFDQTLLVSKRIDRKHAKQNIFKRLIKSILQIFAPLM